MNPPPPPAHRAVLTRTLEHACDYLDLLDGASASARASTAELRARLLRPLPNGGVDPVRVIDDLVAAADGGLLGNTGGRFFGWVIGGGLPSAVAADWLTSIWDQNAGLYACSPFASIVEEACGAWLKELLGLPPTASFALVTGCQMSHATSLAAARHRLLAAHGWNVELQGMSGAPRVRVLAADTLHGSIERAVRLLGMGRDAIEELPVDDDCRLIPAALAEALARQPAAPTIVILQAGDINTGAFDPFEEVVPLAHRQGAWVHVDGAFGLWANASPTHRGNLRGVEHADSWSCDGHKWLNVPYDCGYAFAADREAHQASMSLRASYLTHDEDARDELDWNPEFSRRARGIATYAALRELGRNGMADLVDRCCRFAADLTSRIGALTGAELMWGASLNQGLVRFPDSRPGATEADHAARTDEIIRRIVQSGEAFFGGTNWRGKRCMRISVCGWRTNSSDIDRAVAAASRALTA
jgi:glutamate/tyrosine decarboxylase-like PLP-dependent enzyme